MNAPIADCMCQAFSILLSLLPNALPDTCAHMQMELQYRNRGSVFTTVLLPLQVQQQHHTGAQARAPPSVASLSVQEAGTFPGKQAMVDKAGQLQPQVSVHLSSRSASSVSGGLDRTITASLAELLEAAMNPATEAGMVNASVQALQAPATAQTIPQRPSGDPHHPAGMLISGADTALQAEVEQVRSPIKPL